MAKRFGSDQVIMIDENDPIDMISKATNKRMANVVMDVSGNPKGASLALTLTGQKGTLVLPGLYKNKNVSMDLDLAVTREIKMIGVFPQDSKAVIPAINIGEIRQVSV